ncbi:MAG: cell division protein FtsQ/DivIB [Legionellales bacterium]
MANEDRFPVTTIKVAASYEHVSHKELEDILARNLNASFFFLPVSKLQNELSAINWIDTAYVERVWPDTLKIKLIEKIPVAIWGDALMTKEGSLFNQGVAHSELNIPKFTGPDNQQLLVLQVYEKLVKILSEYGLKASGLYLRDNQSWVLSLGTNAQIYLGKKDLETRLLRFCKAYPAVFAEKSDQLASVDLRYPRGMAVLWKQQTGR